ncbi:hypothetical protein [Streptomyces hydrogenans]|uniref:hypothetical protein n=1 Tax=Streptomyces hydrogenans TaxID=1873719 RepID=UPI0035D7E2B4
MSNEPVAPLTGETRTAVFHMFGVVFGYATHHLDERCLGDVAIVGPLTPGVDSTRLWGMAAKMNKPKARQEEHAQWILAQAHRAFVVGAGRLALWPAATWKLEPGRRVQFLEPWINRDELWTGNLTVEGTTAEMVAPKPTIYTA